MRDDFTFLECQDVETKKRGNESEHTRSKRKEGLNHLQSFCLSATQSVMNCIRDRIDADFYLDQAVNCDDEDEDDRL